MEKRNQLAKSIELVANENGELFFRLPKGSG
jgi:hypothetical protein